MTVVRFGVRVPATGKQGAMDLHHWFRFNGAGKVVQYRGTEDTALEGGAPPKELEHPLHQHDVEPATELPADILFTADLLEAARAVQRDRRLVPADDAPDHRVEAVVTRELDQVGQQQPADALSP